MYLVTNSAHTIEGPPIYCGIPSGSSLLAKIPVNQYLEIKGFIIYYLRYPYLV